MKLDYIFIGIIGIIIWQLLVFLFCLFSAMDEDKIITIATGVWGCVFIMVMKIVDAIKLEWYKRNLVAVQVKNRFEVVRFDGSISYEAGHIFCMFYTTKKIKETLKYDSLNQVRSSSNDVMYIQFSDCSVKSAPNKCEIWKGEERFYDLDMTQFMKK